MNTIDVKEFTKPTTMLDYYHPSIVTLVEQKKWMKLSEVERVKAIYNYIRDEIKFGYNTDDSIRASAVLKDGYGQCNTKGTLFMAILRLCKIPCRIHAFTINKALQKGAMKGLTYKNAPHNIFHSWVEVYLNDTWYELEGFILDKPYLIKLIKKFKNVEGRFVGYGVGVDDFKNPTIDFDLNNTYIQSVGINNDFGVYSSPDLMLKEHNQDLSKIKGFLFRHYGRHTMNRNVSKIRNSK